MWGSAIWLQGFARLFVEPVKFAVKCGDLQLEVAGFLVARATPVAAVLPPRELASIVWASAVIRAELGESLASRAARAAGDGQGAANLAWAFATLGHLDELEALDLDKPMTPPELVSAAWAVATAEDSAPLAFTGKVLLSRLADLGFHGCFDGQQVAAQLHLKNAPATRPPVGQTIS